MNVFGGQSVTLRSYTDGVGRDRMNQPVKNDVDVVVPGCLFRPFRPTETTTLTDVSTEMWRCTAPPVDAALNATATGVLLYGGDSYQIIGVEPFPDLSGVVDHVRITCQRQGL